MRNHLLRFSILAATCGTVLLRAQAPKIIGAAVDPNDRTHIIINFDNPAPAASAVDQKTYWIVYEKLATSPKTNATKRVDVVSVDVTGLQPAQAEKVLVLRLAEAVPGKGVIKEIDIVLANTTDFITLPPLTKATQLGLDTKDVPQGIAAAKGKSDADVYFNGSFTAVQGGDPVYDIDAFAGYMWAMQSKTAYFGSLGAYGQVRTKMSPVADPNSFQTYLVYQNVLGKGWWGPFQSPILNYRFLGAEFDRSAKELNLTTSPILTIPFRPIAPPKIESNKVTQWPAFGLIMGTEFVDVHKSVLAPTGTWHTRGLLGATFAAGYGPKTKGFDSITFTSSWQVRLPSAPEIFYDDKFAPIDPKTGVKNTKATPPMLGTQPRHFIDSKLTYNVTPALGITFEHTYGSLPPAFFKTDQTFAIGLSFSYKMVRGGGFSQTALLRP